MFAADMLPPLKYWAELFEIPILFRIVSGPIEPMFKVTYRDCEPAHSSVQHIMRIESLGKVSASSIMEMALSFWVRLQN